MKANFMNWWAPEKFAAKRHHLEIRAKLIRAVRGYFEGQGFLEVETPSLTVCPGAETHLKAYRVDDLYLHTSPELAMKKLLVAGLPKIFQICHVYRKGESTRLHSPEFTMLEWYRANAGYEDIMQDCENLLRSCAEKLGIKKYKYKSIECDPFGEWQKISVLDAFRKYADIDLISFLPPPLSSPLTEGGGQEGGVKSFRQKADSIGIRTIGTDRWDDIFHAVMAEKIEPHLGMQTPCILYDYPLSMAPLSRRTKDGMGERFELYVCGVELANGYGELTDAAEQRARFDKEMKAKEELYGERWPADEDFFKALEHGMPESGGIALGLDRLAMLATGAEDIEQVLWAGKL